MSTEQLTADALALPVDERVELAQALWESLHDGPPYDDPETEAQEIMRRDAEMSSGAVVGIPHEEVMADAHRDDV